MTYVARLLGQCAERCDKYALLCAGVQVKERRGHRFVQSNGCVPESAINVEIEVFEVLKNKQTIKRGTRAPRR